MYQFNSCTITHLTVSLHSNSGLNSALAIIIYTRTDTPLYGLQALGLYCTTGKLMASFGIIKVIWTFLQCPCGVHCASF